METKPARGTVEYLNHLKDEIGKLENVLNDQQSKRKILAETELLERRLQRLKADVQESGVQAPAVEYRHYTTGNESPARGHKDALHVACNNGSLVLVERCLRSGESVNKHNENGLTPLHVAVLRQSDDVVQVLELLLSYRPAVNGQTLTDEETPLHMAVRFGQVQTLEAVVETLLEYNADTHIKDRRLRRPYDYAVERGLHELAELLASDLPPTLALKHYRKKRAATYGEKLVEAVIKGDLPQIRTCILRKGDVNHLTKSGSGAIHHTITHCPGNKLDVLSILINAGADVNLRNYEDDTALNLVIKSSTLAKDNSMYRLTRRLLEAGTDPSIKDIDGKDAWALAGERKYDDIQSLLRNYSDSVPLCLQETDHSNENRPKESMESLFTAVQKSSLSEVEKQLRQPHININAKTKDGLCVMHLAVIRKEATDKEGILRALNKHGANINATSSPESLTPLHICAETNDKLAAKVLVALRADTQIKNRNGVRAYTLARKLEHHELADIIMDRSSEDTTKPDVKKNSVCNIL